MKDMNLIPADTRILVVGTVQEEDCDGLCWQFIHNEDKITPEFVISTEPTDGGIYRGHAAYGNPCGRPRRLLPWFSSGTRG
jgi:hypothetical protein